MKCTAFEKMMHSRTQWTIILQQHEIRVRVLRTSRWRKDTVHHKCIIASLGYAAAHLRRASPQQLHMHTKTTGS